MNDIQMLTAVLIVAFIALTASTYFAFKGHKGNKNIVIVPDNVVRATERIWNFYRENPEITLAKYRVLTNWEAMYKTHPKDTETILTFVDGNPNSFRSYVEKIMTEETKIVEKAR